MQTSLTFEPMRAANSATSRQWARDRNSAPATKRCHGAEAAASLGAESAQSAPTWSGARPPYRRARPDEVVGRPPRRGQRARAPVLADAAASAVGSAAQLWEPMGESTSDGHRTSSPELSRPGRVEYVHMKPLGRQNPSDQLDDCRTSTDVSRYAPVRLGHTGCASIEHEARVAGAARCRSSSTHRIRRKPRRAATNRPARPCARQRLTPPAWPPSPRRARRAQNRLRATWPTSIAGRCLL